jgi:hypothetical protein
MQRLNKEQTPHRKNGVPRLCGQYASDVAIILLAAMLGMLSACGGSNSGGSQTTEGIAGNWQFSLTNPDTSGKYPAGALYGVQGGFLLQNNASVTGQVVYSFSGPVSGEGNTYAVCDSGTAPITGTISGQTVSLTVAASSQTITLQGAVGSNGQIMSQTGFVTPGGTATGFTSCGLATPAGGSAWSALLVPPLTGPVQGSFHSTGGSAGLSNQEFAVTGSLSQGVNIGASNATVTGTLTFLNQQTNLSDYPCFATASVNGQISGNTVILQLIGLNGAVVGQFGEPAGSLGSTGVNQMTFDSVSGGYILHGAQPNYLVAAKPTCPGSLSSTVTAGDYGDICLGLNNTTACNEPITLSPAFLDFPVQLLGTPATSQTVALTNSSGSTLNNLTATFTYNSGDFNGPSDFNSLPNFAETDNCGTGGVASNGQPFSLNSAQSCTITVSFSPQQACPWLPYPASSPTLDGAAPEWCPFGLSAQLIVNTPASPDNDKSFAVPVTGLGVSAIVPSLPELDFGAEQQPTLSDTGGEASLPQTVSFTNNSAYPLQILSGAPCKNQNGNSHNTLPSPRVANSPVAGLQVVSNDVYQIQPDLNTTPDSITYRCDSDPQTSLANFQISGDTCTGTMLAPQTSCSIQVSYVPQPQTNIGNGLDYFLELNTVQCYGAVTTDCEIDSGRFPVELRSNAASPLRMSPGAGLDFGIQTVGKTSSAMQITLLNDPTVVSPETVTFVGTIGVQGNYAESDDCPVTLAPGSSCTLTVTFKPSATGFLPGSLTINYSPEPNNFPQTIYLRGTGQ